MCVFLSPSPQSTLLPPSKHLSSSSLSSLYLFLFLSIHFSQFPALYVSLILFSRLFPTFFFSLLIYYSHPSLTLSFFPLTPEIPPSAPELQGIYTPTNSASLLGKEIEWWIKEQSEETDKKLWDEQLYRYVKVFLHVVYCTGWHFTPSCVILQKEWFLSTVRTAHWKVETENIIFLTHLRQMSK